MPLDDRELREIQRKLEAVLNSGDDELITEVEEILSFVYHMVTTGQPRGVEWAALPGCQTAGV
jgi:hypothetical protein